MSGKLRNGGGSLCTRAQVSPQEGSTRSTEWQRENEDGELRLAWPRAPALGSMGSSRGRGVGFCFHDQRALRKDPMSRRHWWVLTSSCSLFSSLTFSAELASPFLWETPRHSLHPSLCYGADHLGWMLLTLQIEQEQRGPRASRPRLPRQGLASKKGQRTRQAGSQESRQGDGQAA